VGCSIGVIVRNEDTGELIGFPSSHTDYRKAELKKIELEETADPPGIQTEVEIETLSPELRPAAIRRRR